MGFNLIKKLSVDKNDFFRFFREIIRDPLINRAIKQLPLVNQLNADKTINELLPSKIFDSIVHIESAKGYSGLQKKNYVEATVYAELKKLGLEILFPYFVGKLQILIIYLYKTYYMDKFKQWELHDYIEQLLKTDIDESGSIGSSKSTLFDVTPITISDYDSSKPPDEE